MPRLPSEWPTSKSKGFWGIGNFYYYRLQILANLSGKHFGWNGGKGDSVNSVVSWRQKPVNERLKISGKSTWAEKSEWWPLRSGSCFHAHPRERVRPPTRVKIPKSEKRGFRVKKLPFPSGPEKGRFESTKSLFSLWSPVETWGFFDSKRSFLGCWEMGVFRPRNPLSRILRIWSL